VITCVPRLIGTLIPDGAAPPLGAAVWGDTSIAVDSARPLRDVFTGATMTPVPSGAGHTLAAAAIFARFPVALLVPSGPDGTA
jgi:maltooligosyltrehalose synthase